VPTFFFKNFEAVCTLSPPSRFAVKAPPVFPRPIEIVDPYLVPSAFFFFVGVVFFARLLRPSPRLSPFFARLFLVFNAQDFLCDPEPLSLELTSPPPVDFFCHCLC